MRVDQLEEALQIIRLMWSGQPATFERTHYRVTGARCEPLLDPLPPIVLGAFGPLVLQLAARYADSWNVSSTGDKRYQRLLARFERACAEEGRDLLSFRRSVGGVPGKGSLRPRCGRRI